jgi:tocopherol O-methyltransferase
MIVPHTAPAADAVSHHYDELDELYRDVWGEHVHHGLFATGDESVEEATLALSRRVADAAHIGADTRVVDVGCGYGATARWLAEERGARVVGLTLSAAQAEVARSRRVRAGAPVPEIRVADWLHNDLPDASFDAVIAIESSTHMPDRPRVFGEMARVLVPGGRLAAVIWMAGDAPRPWQVRHLLEPICREGRLFGMGSATENELWARDAGFGEIRVEDLSAQVTRTWVIVAQRLVRGLLRDPRYRAFLFDSTARERLFAVTIGRIWLAYRTGAMRLGLLSATRPRSGDGRALKARS